MNVVKEWSLAEVEIAIQEYREYNCIHRILNILPIPIFSLFQLLIVDQCAFSEVVDYYSIFNNFLYGFKYNFLTYVSGPRRARWPKRNPRSTGNKEIICSKGLVALSEKKKTRPG